ncbi:MAG: SPASM domain-containing protein [Myxococcales bacterium]|nr:SPASM domain-containing protein [Myxococcales bacterium]
MWPFRAKTTPPRRFRYERFGGIAQLGWPRALVFVDRDRARSLGYRDGGALWKGEEPGLDGVLSAPLEAHLQLTNRCDAGCQGCYTGASPKGERGEWGLAEWKLAIDELAERGVFHLALGGGESAVLPWLGEVARHARGRGLVPNLTTSGLLAEEELARLCGIAPLFGQINVSVDGVGEVYARVRGFDGFARADAAVVRLRRATRHVGVNCVVTRDSFEHLGELFAWAKKRRLREVELLRFKPSGRGARTYEKLRCTDAQHLALLPTVLELARRYRRRVRLDCSYTPMITAHAPDPRLVRWLAIYGCAGGDLLIGAKAHGVVTACSFAAPPPGGPTVEKLGAYWGQADAFPPFRAWQEAAREPCRSCEYLALCRGGCRVVSAHVAGDAAAPDPECPRVLAHAASQQAGAGSAMRRLPVVG